MHTRRCVHYIQHCLVDPRAQTQRTERCSQRLGQGALRLRYIGIDGGEQRIVLKAPTKQPDDQFNLVASCLVLTCVC